MQTVSDHLESLLRARGIKPTCEAAGVPLDTVMRWLRGAGRISFDQAERLAAELGHALVLDPATAVRR